MTFHPRMMFADGTVTRDLGAPPEAFNVAASRAANPGDWGDWRQQGDRLIKRFPEDARDYEFSYPGRCSRRFPPPPICVWRVAILRSAACRCRRSAARRSRLRGTPSGSHATAASPMPAAYRPPPRALPPGEQGRYWIEGHAIIFQFDDGREEQRLFFQFPGPDKRGDTFVIGIGGTVYTLR
jgi:hypothetical protein